MSLSWRKKVLLAKTETTYGVDPALTGGMDAVLASNVEITPMEGSDVSRELEQPYFGAQATVPTELHAKISFSVEYVGTVLAGNAPAWGPILRACGIAEVIDPDVSVTYNPVTDAHESLYLSFFVDGVLYSIAGARGTVKINVTAQAVPRFDFEFTGLYSRPVAGAVPTANFAKFKKPQLATTTNPTSLTLNGVSMVTRSAVLDLGNAVETRFLIGADKVLITDRAEAFECTVEAVLPDVFDPFKRTENQNTMPVELIHGNVITERVMTLNMPAAQMQRPQGLANSQNVTEWPLRLVPLPTDGNDQWTLTIT